jgi:hypothetical protein
MNTPTNQIQPSDWVINLHRDPQCQEPPVGTGFFIAPNYVLTCEHVRRYATEKQFFYKPSTSDDKSSKKLTIEDLDSKTHDTSLLVSEENASYFPFLCGDQADEPLKKLLSGNSGVFGRQNLTKPSTVEHIRNIEIDTIQLEGGVTGGHSGGPLVLRDPKYCNSYVFGMARAGGEGAGQTRVITSWQIIEWINSTKPELLNSCKIISLDNILCNIVFHGDTYKQSIQTKWNAQWS